MNRSQVGYFQFPLCGLAFGRTIDERLNGIISFGLIEVGKVLWENGFTAQDRAKQYASWSNPSRVPTDFNYQNMQHVFAVAGASVIGVMLRSMQLTLDQYRAFSSYLQTFIARHGPQPLVRLRASFVFEARDGTGITPEELFVLAGIYSVIGGKRQPVRITQRRIAWRALGYKTEHVYAAEFGRREDGQAPLTEWKIRTTVERLHQRKFFCRRTYGRRLTYYSNRLTEQEFDESLIIMKTRQTAAKSTRRLKDDTLTSAIRQKRAELLAQTAPATNPSELTKIISPAVVISPSHQLSLDNVTTGAPLHLDFNRNDSET